MKLGKLVYFRNKTSSFELLQQLCMDSHFKKLIAERFQYDDRLMSVELLESQMCDKIFGEFQPNAIFYIRDFLSVRFES